MADYDCEIFFSQQPLAVQVKESEILPGKCYKKRGDHER